MNILVVGYGYLGSPLVKKLYQKGHKIWVIKKNPLTDPAPKDITFSFLDITKPLHVKAPFHLDGIVYLVSSHSYSEESYKKTYLDGLNHIIQYTQENYPAARIIFSSSTSVYGDMQGDWVDETSPTNPLYFNGKIILEAEKALQQSKCRSTIVRFAGLYGPGRTGMFQRISSKEIPPHEAYYLNLIHQSDAVGILEFLLEKDHPKEVFIAVDKKPVKTTEIQVWLRKNKIEFSSSLPQTGSPKRKRAEKRCSQAKITKSGYQFQYPDFSQGLKNIIKKTL